MNKFATSHPEWVTRVRMALQSPDGLRRGRDFFAAQALQRLPQGARRRLFAGTGYYCPVCESNLRTFITLHRAYNLLCPVCWSLQRHRFIWIFFREWMLNKLPLDRQWMMLHIAPEPSLARRFVVLPGIQYISADIADPKAMLQMDISNIQFGDATFDLIYCSHVLEHVEEDRKALGEFYRVLKAGGKAVIVVPVKRDQTYEDPSITSAQERERAFGQHDHVREYGWDIVERMEAAGFRIQVIHRTDLATDLDVKRQGLTDNEIIFVLDKNGSIR